MEKVKNFSDYMGVVSGVIGGCGGEFSLSYEGKLLFNGVDVESRISNSDTEFIKQRVIDCKTIGYF